MKQRGKKKKELKEMRTTSETSGPMLNAPTFETGVQDEESKKKDQQKILEIIVEKFPKLGKEIITQLQDLESPKKEKP